MFLFNQGVILVNKNVSLDQQSKSHANTLVFLVELRSRLIACFVLLFIVLAVCLFFANQLYSWLALPLLKYLPAGHLIATQIVSPFFVPFKLAFTVSFLICVPYFLYQIWLFIAPALYSYEKRWCMPFLILSTGLFYAGISFAYWVIFPILFQFLTKVAPVGVMMSPDINEYLNFTTYLMLVFGCLFEIPMIMTILVRLNVVTRKQFIAKRRFAIIGAFVLGMLFAPPDVLSQTILALPIWFLYELGIIFSGVIKHEISNSC